VAVPFVGGDPPDSIRGLVDYSCPWNAAADSRKKSAAEPQAVSASDCGPVGSVHVPALYHSNAEPDPKGYMTEE
jgi:hypothetical protein